MHSPDKEFAVVGARSGIPYQKWFNHYKEFLSKNTDKPQITNLYKWWNGWVFSFDNADKISRIDLDDSSGMDEADLCVGDDPVDLDLEITSAHDMNHNRHNDHADERLSYRFTDLQLEGPSSARVVQEPLALNPVTQLLAQPLEPQACVQVIDTVTPPPKLNLKTKQRKKGDPKGKGKAAEAEPILGGSEEEESHTGIGKGRVLRSNRKG